MAKPILYCKVKKKTKKQKKKLVNFIIVKLHLNKTAKKKKRESFLAPHFENINFLAFSLLYGPPLTCTCLLENYSFDYMDLCLQNDVSAL